MVVMVDIPRVPLDEDTNPTKWLYHWLCRKCIPYSIRLEVVAVHPRSPKSGLRFADPPFRFASSYAAAVLRSRTYRFNLGMSQKMALKNYTKTASRLATCLLRHTQQPIWLLMLVT